VRGGIDDFRNIEDTLHIGDYARRMKEAGDTIRIEGQLVCYDESTMLKRLTQWPYVQLGIVMIFVVVAIFALLSSKKAALNKEPSGQEARPRPIRERNCAIRLTSPIPFQKKPCQSSKTAEIVEIYPKIHHSISLSRKEG